MRFDFSGLPWRIIFECDALKKLPSILDELSLKRALVLTTPRQRHHGEALQALLGSRCVGVFDGAVMHVPLDCVGAAVEAAENTTADCTIAYGGGSTTGLGKALALKKSLPNIAIPTTYSGSEMTNVWGITEGQQKTTGRADAVLPNAVIYDPLLTLDLPIAVSGPSALNAMGQAVANVLSPTANPIAKALGIEAFGTIGSNIEKVISEPNNIEYRATVLYGACLAGATIGVGVTGIHHRLCHTLGGRFNTPHADTHAILLPYSMALCRDALSEEYAKLSAAMNVPDAAHGVFELVKAACPNQNLAQIGIDESCVDEIIALALATPVANSVNFAEADIRDLLHRAVTGEPPS